MRATVITLLRTAFDAVALRPIAGGGGDHHVPIETCAVAVRRIASPPTAWECDGKDAFEQTAMQPRVDAVEWSDTQPWCHQ